MYILEIPRALFQKFSQELGQGEARKEKVDNRNYLIKDLNSQIAGFSGTVGFYEDVRTPLFIFALWKKVPTADDIFGPIPILTISTGKVRVAEIGPKVEEVCWATCDYNSYRDNIDFKRLHMMTQLISSIIQHASELVPEARVKEY